MVPPASVHTRGSSVVHVLQQQHATIGLLQGAAPEQTVLGVKFVPAICAQVPSETYEQTLLAGSQHAPSIWFEQLAVPHALKPSQVPAFLMQSQLVEAMQFWFMQHLPYTAAVGQVLGVHVPPGTYVKAPLHGWAVVTRKQPPVHGWQQAPVPGGHGFGEQEVALLAIVPAGHVEPNGTVVQAPVEGSQHTMPDPGRQLTWAHVWPT